MSLNFPYPAVDGQVFTSNGVVYVYSSTYSSWVISPAANTIVTLVSGTAGQIYSSGGYAPSLNLITTAVTAATYGGSSQIPVITVDAYGRLTSASNIAVQGMDYAYANTIGASSNAWTNAVFGYANTRMESMVAANAVSANAWTNAVFGYSNTYTGLAYTRANASFSNLYVTTVTTGLNFSNTVTGASGNANVVSLGTSSNTIKFVVGAGNSYSVGASSQTTGTGSQLPYYYALCYIQKS